MRDVEPYNISLIRLLYQFFYLRWIGNSLIFSRYIFGFHSRFTMGKHTKRKTQKDYTVTEKIVPHTAMQLRKELLKLGIRVPRSLGFATKKSL